jgi:hypothetical protein
MVARWIFRSRISSRFTWRLSRRTAFTALVTALFWTVATAPAIAAGPDETSLDAVALAELQQRAEHAQPRDQCYLYTEIVHQLTELAGKQMAAGEDEAAGLTIVQLDATTARLQQVSVADARRLKNAEQLLDHTAHRLADMVRVASDQQRSVMQSTLRHLNAVHSSVLGLVFAR